MKSNRIIRYILLYFASALFLAVFVGPFLWMIGASLQLERQLMQVPASLWPDPVSFASYKEIIYGALFDEAVISTEGYSSSYQARVYLHSFVNSGIIALSVSFFSVVFGAYAAYPIARLNFRGRYTLLFPFWLSDLCQLYPWPFPLCSLLSKWG